MDSRSLGFLDVSGCGVDIWMHNINYFIRNSQWKCHYLIKIRKFGQKFIGLLEALCVDAHNGKWKQVYRINIDAANSYQMYYLQPKMRFYLSYGYCKVMQKCGC